MTKDEFLIFVRDFVHENPEVAAYISDFVAAGLEASRKELLERAADMEVALAVALAKRYHHRETLILDKISKWNGKSALRWDDTIKMLEERK